MSKKKISVIVGSLRKGSFNKKIATEVIKAFGANHHLRQSMVFVDVPMMQQPEAYIGNAQRLFDESGNLVEDTGIFLQNFIDAYENWVNKF